MNLRLLALAFSLGGPLCSLALASPSPTDLAGRWEAMVEFGKIRFKLAVNVTKSPDGRIEGKIDIPEQGARGIPVSAMLFNYPAVRWEIDPFQTAFNGQLNGATNEIAGAFEEGPGGRPIAVTFKKAELTALPKPVYSFAAGEPLDFRGYWAGSVDSDTDHASRLGLKIGRLPDKNFTVEVDIFDRGQQGLLASAVKVSNATLIAEWPLQHLTLTGKLTGEGNQLQSDWSTGSRLSPLVFKRLDHPATLFPEGVSFTPDPQARDDIRGQWNGALDVQGTKLRIIIKLGRTPEGALVGTLTSPDQGPGEIPISAAGYTNPVVRLEFKGINGVYSGKLNAQGTHMEGSWKQGGPPLDLKLARAALPEGGKP